MPLLRSSSEFFIMNRGKKILQLARSVNDEKENIENIAENLIFLPPYETTKGTSREDQLKAITWFEQVTWEVPHSQLLNEKQVVNETIAQIHGHSRKDKIIKEMPKNSIKKRNKYIRETNLKNKTQNVEETLDNFDSSSETGDFSPLVSEYIPSEDDFSSDDNHDSYKSKIDKKRSVLHQNNVTNSNLNKENENSDKNMNSSMNVSNKIIDTNSNQRNVSKGKRTTDFCYLCESAVLNFARHLKRNHMQEIEVQRIFSMPPKNLKRKILISNLRKKGNYLINLDKCIKPIKKSNFPGDVEYVPCKHCLGFYRPKQLWRHVRKCPLFKGENSKSNHLSDSQSVLTNHMEIDQELRDVVFPKMMADKISLKAKKDFLICKFGSRYLKSHREKHLINVCSRKMRELARLLIEIQKLNSTILNMYDVLQPIHFDLVVAATKIVAKFNPITKVFESPTYAMNIQTSLKQCCDIAILVTLKRKKFNSSLDIASMESNFKTFKQLLEDSWKFEISTVAGYDLSVKKWNKITILPLAIDLKLFRNYLLRKANTATNLLRTNEKDENAYRLLMETVFCRLLLLNRKRVGELERMQLHVYEKASVHHSSEEFENTITPTEKILLTKFKRVVTRGKRGRGVPVLFSLDIQEHVKLLLDLRINFVTNNTYLFPKIGTTNPITGYQVMKKHTKLAKLKNPDALTSTRLRKHLATLTQIFNMSSNDIEQLATFMGHTNDIHKQVYRLPDDVYQTTKISKLLTLMEKGQAAEYKGKTLDEIELNLEEEDNLEEEGEEERREEEEIEEIEEKEREECKTRESESEVLSERTEEIPNNSSKPKNKKRVLIPWTDEQKRLTKLHFQNHIKKKIPPKKNECEDLRRAYPDQFRNKSWPVIKVFIKIYIKLLNTNFYFCKARLNHYVLVEFERLFVWVILCFYVSLFQLNLNSFDKYSFYLYTLIFYIFLK
ncbi:hypothetical protein FQR65_LT16723 [Abscondita terminalis]|nr:hypothetical protein FQR65_LT16723 [Abscondita terminalis]